MLSPRKDRASRWPRSHRELATSTRGFRLACGAASSRMLIQSRQDARQPIECRLKTLVLDPGEIAGGVAQHPLIRRNRSRRLVAEPLVEIDDRHVESTGDLVQSANRDTVDAAFVSVHPLTANA